jgi:DNA polymerase-1
LPAIIFLFSFDFMNQPITLDAKKLLLIDGSSYLYRAFFAMPDMRVDNKNPDSPATGAIRGMVNMMQSLRKEYPYHYCACIFDAKGPTFRDEWYPAYKANRSPMPDDLRSQIEPVHEVVSLLGFPVMAVTGVEADDVIGTLAQEAAKQGIEVIISSGDKDLSQLVDAHITIIDTMNGKRRDIEGVTQEFGVPPHLMLDYQTLVGDAVDNVPGVPKVGPKTAVKWLNEYGSLDAVVANSANIKGVVGENLRNSLEWLPQAKRLLQIKTDCLLDQEIKGYPSLEAITFKEPDTAKLIVFYERFGFKGLLKNMQTQAQKSASNGAEAVPDLFTQGVGTSEFAATSPSSTMTSLESNQNSPHSSGQQDDLFASNPAQASTKKYQTVQTPEQLALLIAQIKTASLVAIDTETTSLVPLAARIVGISVCMQADEAYYIPLAHVSTETQLPLQEVLDQLQPLLENPSIKKLGQNMKYDRHVFANHGIQVAGFQHDTMLQSYVLEVHKPHGLASLALRHCGLKGLSYEDLCGKGAHQIGFDQVDIEKASLYSCEDAEFTLQVHQTLWPHLQNNPQLLAVYELEIASSEALFRIERNGVLIDGPLLAQQSTELGKRILELEQQAYEIAGQTFNLASPKQIGEIFFEKLGLPVVKKTATGAPSTDEEVLEKLAEDFPLPAKILEFRSLAKLKGTYTDKLAQLADPTTKRVHTNYAQSVAVTGRLSSLDPNLQNIPIRTPEGRRIREAFVAAPGCVIASADYSQIELRIMAHLSDDAALLKAFQEGYDVHRATAAEVFGVSVDQVSSEQRRFAKVINFGLIYGMSAYGLARNLNIDNTSAKNYIQRYFERYPGVKNYMDSTRALAKQQGYVETVMGRRLYLPEINSPNGPRRAGAERAAINAPMQGTAADLIKLSMVAVQNRLEAENKKTKMIMQVHDELVFEVPQDELAWVTQAIPAIMAKVAQLKVPLLAELGQGPNWEQAH